jgi:hypothetical protein
MANSNTLLVKDGFLYPGSGRRIRLETVAWFTWLASATLFSYPAATGFCLTLRREKRRNSFYWFAYLKKGGNLHKKHVGRSAALTIARLDEVAW